MAAGYRTYRQGRSAEVEPLHERALAIREKALGPDHPNVAACVENYTALLRKTNREAEAGKWRPGPRRFGPSSREWGSTQAVWEALRWGGGRKRGRGSLDSLVLRTRPVCCRSRPEGVSASRLILRPTARSQVYVGKAPPVECP